MKKLISLLLLAVLPLASCAGAAGTPLESLAAMAVESATYPDPSTSNTPYVSISCSMPSPSPQTVLSLKPADYPPIILVPYSPDDFSPSFPIGIGIIEHEGYVYYVDNGAMYKMNESTGRKELVLKKKEPIRELFFDKDGNLYYTADDFTPADESGTYSKNLYKYVNGKESMLIKDISPYCDCIFLLADRYIYYNNGTLGRYGIDSGKSEKILSLPEGVELDLAGSIHINGKFLYYDEYTSISTPRQSEFVVNMETNETYEIHCDNSQWFSADSIDNSLYYKSDGMDTDLMVFYFDTQANTGYHAPIAINGFICDYILLDRCIYIIDSDNKTQQSILWKIDLDDSAAVFNQKFDGVLNDSDLADGKWYLHFKLYKDYDETSGSIISYDLASNSVKVISKYGELPDDKCISRIAVLGGYLWEFGMVIMNYDDYPILLSRKPITP